VQVNIKNLIDDGQCYQTVRELRWPDGIECPSCQSTHVINPTATLVEHGLLSQRFTGA
jgi:hypothetical protein